MKKSYRTSKAFTLLIIIISALIIPFAIWMFVAADVEKDNFGKFKAGVLAFLAVFHLIIYTRSYNRLRKNNQT